MESNSKYDFIKCKDCELIDLDYEIRKDTLKCHSCKISNDCDRLKEEIFKTKPFLKIIFPLVKLLNIFLEKVNNLLRRK